MNEGNNTPRAQPRAGSIRYAAALAVLQESIQQLGDLVRLQAAELDRLTSRSTSIDTAVNSWRFATEVVTDALNRLESAHAVVDGMSSAVLCTIRDAEAASSDKDSRLP